MTSTAAPSPAGPAILARVSDVGCGAPSFQAVLSYWGFDSFETDLRAHLNTTPVPGTYPWDMVRVATSLGLEAEWKDNLITADLEPPLRDGVPVNCRRPVHEGAR
ncbi:hypothetical protein ACK11Z_02690 [Methanoculleus bourgensis]|uniref:hypothetical protein n=1 Tax=Methanoculleus bourgensis TaxID=83986 RepID=UPI003B966475